MLTPKIKRLLDFIIERTATSGGVCPSYLEMMVGLDLKSKASIHRMIGELEERGYVRRIPHGKRRIEVVRKPGALMDAVAFVAAAKAYLPSDQFLDIVALANGHPGAMSSSERAVEATRKLLDSAGRDQRMEVL